MKNEITVIGKIKVFERDGKQWTTSLNIAEVFGKEHFHVLKSVENLECSQEFRRTNFRLSSYINSQNKEQKMYDLTRDGFSFLVMGFTGSKAAQFKEAYIEAFHKMEEYIRKQLEVNDRSLIVYERCHQELMEMQKVNQEILKSVSGTINNMGGRVERVEDDVSVIKNDVADIKVEISNFKNVIPLNRRKVSKQDRRTHVVFIADDRHGECPICKTQIVDQYKKENDDFCIDHEINRHERGLNQTWGICKSCNAKKSNGTLGRTERDCRTLFDSYHVDLQSWQNKRPRQVEIYQMAK